MSMNKMKPTFAFAVIVASTMNVTAAFAISSENSTNLSEFSLSEPKYVAEGTGEGGGPGGPSNPGVPELPEPTPSVPVGCKFDLNGDGQVCAIDLDLSLDMFKGYEPCGAPDGYVCNVMLIASVVDHLGLKTCPVLNRPAATGCAGDHNSDGHICADDIEYAVDMFQTGQTYPGTTRLWNVTDISMAVTHRGQFCVAIEDPGMGDEDNGDDEQDPISPDFEAPDVEDPRIHELEAELEAASEELFAAHAKTEKVKKELSAANARAKATKAEFDAKKRAYEKKIRALKRKIAGFSNTAEGRK